MMLEEPQPLVQSLWFLAVLGACFGCVVALIASSILAWVFHRRATRKYQTFRQELETALDKKSQALEQELAAVLRREFQPLNRGLKDLLDQTILRTERAASLYPSLADLLDDKLAMLNVPNGRHELGLEGVPTADS